MTKPYPQRIDSHQLEELSKRHFINLLPRDWYSESPNSDYGVDLKVDIVENENVTGLEILIQLKSSQTARKSGYETIRIKTSTYNYLWDKLQVVMLVKYVEAEKEAYWLLLSNVPEPNQKQKTFTIRIPKQNRISSIDWKAIKDYVHEVNSGKIATRRRNRFGN